MTTVLPINVTNPVNLKGSTYNAVKIKINDPKTIIPEEGFSGKDNNIYNSVNIEVNRPTTEVAKKIYNYPTSENIITSDMIGMGGVNIDKMPKMPVAYNFINNKTMINAEIEYESKCPDCGKEVNKGVNKGVNKEGNDKEPSISQNDIPVLVEEVFVEEIKIPEPNIETVEEQKVLPESEISFHGNDSIKKVPEIVPGEEIKPDIDIPKVIENLSNEDFDIQALQMEEIARTAAENSEKAKGYIVTEVFTELINILKKDTSGLNPPTENQLEKRKQIIINEIVTEQAVLNGQDPKKIDLPYKMSEKEMKEAVLLSPMEQAERNKGYSLYIMAILTKNYIKDFEEKTGNVVPLTDLPGVSEMVDVLRYEDNSDIKFTAIEALTYLNRPEYNEEIKSVLTLAAKDKNPHVATYAAITLEKLS